MSRRDWDQRSDALVQPPGAPGPTPDDQLEVITVVALEDILSVLGEGGWTGTDGRFIRPANLIREHFSTVFDGPLDSST